jgi:indolepyruvate ferredoxin oxidoreductase
MAIKDEYEVARLYSDGSFRRQLEAEFESFERLEFHMAPPVLGRRGEDGLARKSRFGPWVMRLFPVLAAMRGLRGGMFDPFGRTSERRMERRLLADYEHDVDMLVRDLDGARLEAATALASVPAMIRGFGHVKEAAVVRAAGERERLLKRLSGARTDPELAAAE